MTKPLPIKRRTKKSKKRLARTPTNYIDCIIKLFNTLQNKLRCQKYLGLYFGNSLQPNDVKLLDKFNRLAVDLVGDEEHLLENCHRLVEKFAELKVCKRADDAGLWETLHNLADDKYILKNINNVSQPQAEKDFLWMNTSCVSLNVDKNECEEFFQACQRSARKIAVSKISKDTQSLGDFPIEPNSEKDFIPNPSTKLKEITENFDVKVQIDPKPQEKASEKTDIASKQLEKKTERIKIVYKVAEKPQGNLQIVPKPGENKKEKRDINPNYLENTLNQLINSNLLRKVPTSRKNVSKKSDKKAGNLQIVPKSTEMKPEILQVVPKPEDNKKNLDIVPNSLKKETTKLQIVPKALETNSDKVVDPKPVEKKAEKLKKVIKTVEKKTQNPQIVPKLAENKPENLQIVPKSAENKKEKLDIVPNSLNKQTTKLQIDPKPLEKKAEQPKKALKTVEKKTENSQIVPKLAENKPEKLQIVPKSTENKKEKLDIVPNSLNKQKTELQIVPKELEKNTEKLINPKPLEKKAEKPKIVVKTEEKKTGNLQIVPKSVENKPENLQIVAKSLQKTPKTNEIDPKPLVKKALECPTEKNLEKLESVSKPLEKKTENKTENLQIVSKSAENKPEKSLQKTPKTTEIVPKQLVKETVECRTIENPSEKNLKNLENVSKPLEEKPGKDNTVLERKEKEIKESETVPTQRERTQALKDFRFSSAEKKKMGKYNSNMFNPTRKLVDPGKTNKRTIILDGSNVAFAHSRKAFFSSEGLKYCLQYFDGMGHIVKAIVPMFRRNAFQSSNPQLLDELYTKGMIVFTPCKNIPGQKTISYDDRFILQLADEWNAAVVSNDNYRDLIDESPAFKMIVETRVLGYTWCDDIFILPKDPYGRWGPTLDEILQC